LLAFKNTKKIKKIKFTKKKKVEGPILRSMQHFTYKYWLTTQTKGGNFETSEKYKKKNPKPKPISNPKKEEAARPPFPRSEKTRESRGGRKPPFPCLQRPAAPPL